MSQTSTPSVTVLPLPPAGPGILLRALCKRPRPASPEAFALPETVHALPPIAPAALARYTALLGFAAGADTPACPLTFLYLPTQRAHLATLLAPGFPFRVIGMVHVENALREHRPHALARPLLLTTRAQIEAPTRTGARFVRLETTGSDSDGAVFTCTSLYLAQAGAGRADGKRAEPPAIAGTVIGGWRVGPETGRAYARVSGDFNPIHLGRWPARLLGMRRPIIHGMHSVGRAAAALEAAEGARVTAIAARFRAPVALGTEVVLLRGPAPDSFVLTSGGRCAVEGNYRTAPAAGSAS